MQQEKGAGAQWVTGVVKLSAVYDKLDEQPASEESIEQAIEDNQATGTGKTKQLIYLVVIDHQLRDFLAGIHSYLVRYECGRKRSVTSEIAPELYHPLARGVH